MKIERKVITQRQAILLAELGVNAPTQYKWEKADGGILDLAFNLSEESSVWAYDAGDLDVALVAGVVCSRDGAGTWTCFLAGGHPCWNTTAETSVWAKADFLIKILTSKNPMPLRPINERLLNG